MKFLHETDLFQFFVNEYISPCSKVLVIGEYNSKIRQMIEFIDSEVFFVNENMEPGIDIVSSYTNLPFEEESFDSIINFTNELDIFSFVKHKGFIIIKEEILNGLDYYTLNEQTFTILQK